MMEILQLDDVSRMLDEPYITWLKDQDLISERPVDVLAKIWSGVYKVYVAIDTRGKPHGMIVCAFDNYVCTTILIHAKDQVLKLRDRFYNMLKEKGCTTVCTYTKNRSDAYERLIGMKHVYSLYRRVL